MVQFISLRGDFGFGFGFCRSGRGRPHGTKLRTAHYFSIRKLRLSKNFPPFGRCVAVRALRQNLPTSTIALDPYEFRSLQGVLI